MVIFVVSRSQSAGRSVRHTKFRKSRGALMTRIAGSGTATRCLFYLLRRRLRVAVEAPSQIGSTIGLRQRERLWPKTHKEGLPLARLSSRETKLIQTTLPGLDYCPSNMTVCIITDRHVGVFQWKYYEHLNLGNRTVTLRTSLNDACNSISWPCHTWGG
jgi:hypothetical protein